MIKAISAITIVLVASAAANAFATPLDPDLTAPTPMNACQEPCTGRLKCIEGKCYRDVCDNSDGQCRYMPALGCAKC